MSSSSSFIHTSSVGAPVARQHIPVLLAEVVAGLALAPGHRVIDATVGDGGHAAAILAQTSPNGQLLALDADPVSIGRAKQTLHRFGDRVTFVQTNFSNLAAVSADHPQFQQVDGILFDLGYSSTQIDDAARGFSFTGPGQLDMRYGGESQRSLKAADVVSTFSASALADVLREYGEERHAAAIAHEIIRERAKTKISHPEQLTSAVLRVYRRLGHRPKRIHPATKTFMALRILVNDELAALRTGLAAALSLLAPHGRLALISFHSLEDRIVKQRFRTESRDCICPPELPVCRCGHQATLRIVTKHARTPTGDELAHNPRCRSARLRIVERIEPTTNETHTQ